MYFHFKDCHSQSSSTDILCWGSHLRWQLSSFQRESFVMPFAAEKEEQKEWGNASNCQEDKVGKGSHGQRKGQVLDYWSKRHIERDWTWTLSRKGNQTEWTQDKRSYLAKVTRSGQAENGQEKNRRMRIVVILEGGRHGEPEDHAGWCRWEPNCSHSIFLPASFGRLIDAHSA